MEIFKEQRKIAYIITLPNFGGAQSHLYEVMVNIVAYGFKPFLITGCEGWLTEQLRTKDIECYIVPDLVRPISPLNDLKAVKNVKKILQQKQPDLVHCHSSKAGIIGRIAAHACHIPAIFTAHGWAFTDGVRPLKRKLYAFIENLAGYWTDKIICVSDYDKKLGMKYLPSHKDKMLTIHNCIPDCPKLVRDFKKNPVGEIISVVVVARFSPQKKNIQTLHILRKALDIGIKLKITYIGSGPQLDRAKEEARRLHLEDDAIFLGSRTDVAELLTKYDLFLLLSNWEGFPISILEAMRAGLPIVASDVGGVNEAIKNNLNGFLISRDDRNIFDVLKQFYVDKALLGKMGENSREIIKESFLSENMLGKLNCVYKQVLS